VVLCSLSVCATAVAAVTAATGGFDITLAGLPIRIHAVLRPIVAALVFGTMAGVALGADAAPAGFARITTFLQRRAAALAVAAAVLAGVAAYLQGAHIAAGADASGYLSQARLWRGSSLRIETPLAREVSVSHGQYAFTPIGYQPGGSTGVAVPAYPPGLPIQFAIAQAIGGDEAAFVVVPLSATGLVIVTFLIGRRIGGAATGLMAAAACASSPIMLFQAMQPMSDVPAAFWWSLALLLLTVDGRLAALGAGVSAAIACSVRPNLFVMAPAAALLAAWWHGPTRASVVRSAIFLAGPVVAATAIAALQRDLYGDASMTGYGPLSTLFALAHAWPNAGRYAGWAMLTHSALLGLAIAAPFAIRRGFITPAIDRRQAERIAWSYLALFIVLQAFYLLYLVFDQWNSFRFLLPQLPSLLVLQAAVLAAILGACAPRPLQGAAVLIVAMLIASWGVARARALGALDLGDSERRYLDVAAFVREQRPGAAVITVQHSGSLPYYTAASVVRWDWLEPDDLDRVVSGVQSVRRPLLTVLDEWEEAGFRARFASTRAVHLLGAPIFSAGGPPGVTTRVYQMGASP
jgi:hypothetical protein